MFLYKSRQESYIPKTDPKLHATAFPGNRTFFRERAVCKGKRFEVTALCLKETGFKHPGKGYQTKKREFQLQESKRAGLIEHSTEK